MGAVKSRADKTTQKTEGMQRVTLTPARMTDADGGPKVGKRSEKTSKISRCRTELQFPDLIRTRVREANEETKAVFGGLGDMTVRWPTARQGAAKKWTENFGFLSSISPIQQLNVLRRVSRVS